MDTRLQIHTFINDWTEIPINELHDDFDIINDIDWNRFEPDEAGEAFFDIFLTEFKIYVSGDYSDFVREKRIPECLQRIFRPFYAALIGDPLRGIDFEHITIGELVKIVEAGHWIEGPGHYIIKDTK